MIDKQNRQINYLRISVTDQCNFRCTYCMPEEGISCMANEERLTFDEILKICRSGAALGIQKIKITGGEPLVRKDLAVLIKQIKEIPGIDEVTLTTNGFLLADKIEDLVNAGVDRINVSLDTLRHDRFKEITRIDGLDKVLAGIHKAMTYPLKSLKINCLVAKHFNEDEICDLARLAKSGKVSVRFIELMPIGMGPKLEPMSKEEIKLKLEQSFGPLKPYGGKMGNGPAKYYEIEGFKGKIGFISAVSECFCEECNRIRLTADGFLKLCLHSKDGVDLKRLLRVGITEEKLTQVIKDATEGKPVQHHFNDLQPDNIEDKIMAQIGG